MRAVAFRKWTLNQGLHFLILTAPNWVRFDYRLRPSSVRRASWLTHE